MIRELEAQHKEARRSLRRSWLQRLNTGQVASVERPLQNFVSDWMEWWRLVELNHRHADFQSQADFCNINCINWLAGALVALNAPRCMTVQD